MEIEELKKVAGFDAVDKFVTSNMVLGLGTGSTVKHSIDRLGQLLKDGKLTNIRGIPTSVATEKQAISLGIPLVELHEVEAIDVAIDGADEVDANLNLVKGRGGALLREKLVELCAKKLVIIADHTKDTPEGLGAHGAMPIEVAVFGAEVTLRKIKALPSLSSLAKLEAKFRVSKENPAERYKTDNGNFIVDLYSPDAYPNPEKVAEELEGLCGVVEHGLFLNMADVVIFATPTGLDQREKKRQD